MLAMQVLHRLKQEYGPERPQIRRINGLQNPKIPSPATLGSGSLRLDASISLISTMIANDNLIEGGGGSPSLDYLINNQANAQTESYISKALFGFAIPSVWAVSGTASFVVNSGYDCSAQSPLTDYMTASSQNIATITNEAIFKYASNVSVGAKGYMECGGNAGKKVVRGLY
ncbi:hypothetical protein CBS63078_6420 [Aspergillus niger]|nr:hypothetical protein CBS11350_8500 [Aspergillus niger]KAI2852084.1 hypothetical protein CBS12448_8330 [Aspergillus niger]KAI2902088.1 hypothetical protein CBS63078_6420 [Aspergillus niger]KAI2934404.1 hypothetical protein CBS147320_980 [Aspergillus niger]KAI2935161.1 hypothetical protein CBS147321_9091 [Aspergillus niger]